MKRLLAATSVLGLLVVLALPQQASGAAEPPPPYTLIQLGPTGGHPAAAGHAINDRGVVVGTASDWRYFSRTAFTWVGGQAQELPGPADLYNTYALAINDRGVAVGAGSWDEAGGYRPAVWSGGTGRTLPMPPGYFYGEASDVNDLGDIVGTGYEASVNGGVDALVWRRGKDPQVLSRPEGAIGTRAYGINNRGTVVGEAVTPDQRRHAVIWTDGRPSLLAVPSGSGPHHQATDISDRGVVLGAILSEGLQPTLPVRWDGGVMRQLQLPEGAVRAEAHGVNISGVVVGTAYGAENAEAVRWVGAAPVLLPRPAGTLSAFASGINDAGVIVGQAVYEDAEVEPGVRAVLWVPAP